MALRCPLLCLALGVLAMQARGLTLVADGHSDYTITLPPEADLPTQTAARELQQHLVSATGATLSIVGEMEAPAGRPRIVLGTGPAFSAACPDVDTASLASDAIVLRTVGDELYLAGGRPRGTLYAVYTFLEDVVGVRWWSSTETFIPTTSTLVVPPLHTVSTPPLQYRENFHRDAFEGVFAARSKCNGHFAGIAPEYGGHKRILGWCHTFYALIPPEKYFADHPEWFSELNGRRTADHAQLCLTNEAMRRELVRNALEWIDREPATGIISVTQNDWGGACRCERCREIAQREHSQSGVLLTFVNAVAEEIERTHPEILVETLAYQYTRKPPLTVRPRSNVIVRLCPIECSYSQPLGTGPQNREFREELEGWSRVAPKLYVWDYVTNFRNYILPHPNLRVLAPNIRLFVEHGAIGLGQQGDAGSSCSDFPEMRAWVLARLLWDPSRDEKALFREFLEGYYGAAAPHLQAYIDLIHDAVEVAGTYLRCFMEDTSGYLGPEELARAAELFDAAAAAVAEDEVLSGRVRRARMPLDHELIQRYPWLRRIAAMNGTPFAGPADPAAFVEDFIRTARAFNVGQYSEGRPFAEYEPVLRARFQGSAPPPPPEAEGLAEADWIDIQDGRFLLHNIGTWVTRVDDALASDTRAARMSGGHTQWATQFPVPGDLCRLGRWRAYVVARCEPRATAGAAFEVGLCDADEGKVVTSRTVRIEELTEAGYRAYDLGVHALRSGMYFWVAPMGNADEVEAVYTDRIFLVRER